MQSLDFFTPVVDDPYAFGQIAAANSLSDIYAMGGTPVTAMNIVCFPSKDMPLDHLKKILQGGIDKVHEAGAVLMGGHSVDDREPKYGLAVTGTVHPDKFVTNAGALPGDRLILTKPLGTGILSTALKGGMLTPEITTQVIDVMKTLNRDASEAMMEIGVNSATDITGFGLAGHALEMAEASRVRIFIRASRVPVIPGTMDYLKQGLLPEGDYANMDFCRDKVTVDPAVDKNMKDLLFDAQTSGGLLISVTEQRSEDLLIRLMEKGLVEASVTGWVEDGFPGISLVP